MLEELLGLRGGAAVTTGLAVALAAAAIAMSVALHRRIMRLEEELRRNTSLHMPARIVLIRHGESEANVDANFYGRSPRPRYPEWKRLSPPLKPHSHFLQVKRATPTCS